MATPLHFTGPKHLLGFLRGHAVGESILHEAMTEHCEGCRFQQRRKRRRPVLLVLHSDGYAEVHGSGIQVLVVQALAADGAERELFAEKYLEDNLPRRFQRVYQGWGRGTGDVCKVQTVDDEIARLQALIFLRDLEAWRKRWSAPSEAYIAGPDCR